MGILDNFEKGLERAVNSAFAKTFKSGLQPVEITAALRRELDTKAVVVARDRVLVPNKFRVRLAPADFRRMRDLGESLIEEFIELIEKHASSQHYYFAGPIAIQLEEDSSLTVGVVQIDSENVKGTVSWMPVLQIGKEQYPISKSRTIIGRGSGADVPVHDTGASRQHIEIMWDGNHAHVRDLGSTNGSFLNGKQLKQAVLEPESVIEIGQTRIVFRVVPSSTDSDGPAPSSDKSNTRGRPKT